MLRHAFRKIYSALSPPSKLMNLPPEIWIAILQHLSLSELARTLSISRSWHTLGLDPALWSFILLAGDNPALDLVILRLCLARVGDAPVSVEVHTDGERQEAESSAGHEPTSRILHVLSAHSWHIKHLVLHLRTFNPRAPHIELPVEDIRDYLRHGALKHFLKKPKPVLESCAISMQWDHIATGPAVLRLFKYNAPRLTQLRLAFHGGVEQLPDPNVFPSVQQWHFDGGKLSKAWPWDWENLWAALEERGYFERQEVVFSQAFESLLELPNISGTIRFEKWQTRRMEYRQGPQGLTGYLSLATQEHPVRLDVFFDKQQVSQLVINDAAAMALVEDLELHVCPVPAAPILVPNTPMPLLRRLSIACRTANYNTVTSGADGISEAVLSPALEEVRVKRWGKEREERITVNGQWLASFLSQRVRASGQRIPLLRLDLRSGLQFEEGFDAALRLVTDCADVVVLN